jgi:hypothetical protein
MRKDVISIYNITPLHKLGRRATMEDIYEISLHDSNVRYCLMAHEISPENFTREQALICLVYILYEEKTKYFNELMMVYQTR